MYGNRKKRINTYNLDEKLKPNINVNGYKLKNKFIEAGYKKAEYEICGLSTWLGKPIKLYLHHKDGDHKYDLPFKSKEIKSYSDEEWVLI